ILERLLNSYGLDTSQKIKIVRHRDKNRGYDLSLLYQTGQLDIYQSYQESPEFHDCRYIVSFLGLERNQAILIGVYRIISIKDASEVPLPDDFIYYKIFKPKRIYYYELEEIPGFEDLKDRLIIKWSGGAINWVQRLGKSPMEIVQMLPKGYVSYFPGYLDFILNYDELKRIINYPDAHQDWHKMLAAVSGVYMIVDSITGKQYIGSASGKEGILGRFKIYSKSADGGNKELKKLVESSYLYEKNFQFTLLETLPLSMSRTEVIQRENLYKKKMSSRIYGMNLN
ncbi:GIY-YIG nuclease family protein, partial [Terribacillus saccharophilus]|uniref:GIY-YIG nuclease family protein n=1 Tax=Terribacillus saccharophilus TaxID=361277 RepID=UPI002DCEDA66|nr:GIY-YIG nuclease family protein [Terribacillus saccharophilus]